MQLKKRKLITVTPIAVALNVFTFAFAFPMAFQLPKDSVYARDFSAYYIGEWRLLHNPTQIYYGGIIQHDFPILPRPQTFKYTPSFLILFAPFFTLSYSNSLAAFDILQFALIPALAFCIYKLVKDKSLILASIASVIVLIDPLPALSLSNSTLNLLGVRVESLNAQSFSPSYFSGYMMGNAHVLQTTLLVAALYFGYVKKPWLSALLFTFGAFDPRAALLALPLLIWYNRQVLTKFFTGAAIFLTASNLPFFFYYSIGFNFLHSELSGNIPYQMYPYDWIPTYSIVILTIIEAATVLSNRGTHLSFPRKPKNSQNQTNLTGIEKKQIKNEM
jgi:hypothetical protein